MASLMSAIVKVIEDKAKTMSDEDIRGNLFAWGAMKQDIYSDIRAFQKNDFDVLKKGSLDFYCMANARHLLDVNNFCDLMQLVLYTQQELTEKEKSNVV